MKALLKALQEGRLVELPDNDKTDALEFLAALIEAIPEVQVEDQVTEKIIARETLHNTGIGKGWACPHATTLRDAELVCSVGWSPNGIRYGSPDGEPVRLVVMYFVPEPQKNAYLKEISSLAKAIHQTPALQQLQELQELSEVRHTLLDAISHAIESVGPEARARMIQLEVRHAASQLMTPSKTTLSDLVHHLLPFSLLVSAEAPPIILAQDQLLVQQLESINSLAPQLAEHGFLEHQGVSVALRSTEHFSKDRVLYHCIAVRIP
ncbi:MAG: PTS sugar transporter subunit IIA [Chthoniobacterales bacterium]|nr:PTS sugar transporter subunit IIA [Chthoniobacterales bacterium]